MLASPGQTEKQVRNSLEYSQVYVHREMIRLQRKLKQGDGRYKKKKHFSEALHTRQSNDTKTNFYQLA